MAGMLGGANHLGMGERPSESHNWVPGMGWVFMPTFEEGNEANVQAAARGNNDAFQYEVDGRSVDDAQASGVTSYGSAQGYSLPAEVSAKIRARQASHEWYTGGMDHYDGPVDGGSEWKAAAGAWVNDRNGKPTISPWVNTFDHDAELTHNRLRQDNYNPFLGREGRWVGDEQAGVSDLNGYNDNSIAAWFKDQFAGEDMVKHRWEALNTLNGWNSQVRNPNYQSNMDRSEKWMNGEGHGINKGTQRMTKRYFDQMDLGNKFGLTFVDPRQAQYDEIAAGFSSPSERTGGFMDSYDGSRPTSETAAPQPKAGGFLESYLKKQAETKPSVMSLMTELKDA